MTIQSAPTIGRFTRRACLATAASVLAIGLTAGVSVAQEKFPDKTIEVVTHAGAGGGTDVTTRMMMLRGRREAGIDLIAPSDLRGLYAPFAERKERMPIAFVIGSHQIGRAHV